MLTYNRIKIEHEPQKECILLRFNQYDYAIDEIHDMFDTIKAQFPEGTIVVCVPNNIDFKFYDKDQLIRELESTIEYVKAGSNNEYLH